MRQRFCWYEEFLNTLVVMEVERRLEYNTSELSPGIFPRYAWLFRSAKIVLVLRNLHRLLLWNLVLTKNASRLNFTHHLSNHWSISVFHKSVKNVFAIIAPVLPATVNVFALHCVLSGHCFEITVVLLKGNHRVCFSFSHTLSGCYLLVCTWK